MLVVILMLALRQVLERIQERGRKPSGVYGMWIHSVDFRLYDGLCIHPFVDRTGIYADERHGC